MTYATTPILGVNLSEVFTPGTTGYPYTSDVPPIALGQVVQGTDETEFVYCLASGAIAEGDVVTLNSTYTASSITTTNAAFGNQTGVSGVDIASGSYGWIQRAGPAPSVNVAGSCGANVQLTTTATPGVLDDATTTALKYVNGIIITSANTTATVVAKAGMLNFPVVGATI